MKLSERLEVYTRSEIPVHQDMTELISEIRQLEEDRERLDVLWSDTTIRALAAERENEQLRAHILELQAHHNKLLEELKD
jgi:hypothetical protein